MTSFLHVVTSWPCLSPHGQKPCEGTLVVISDGDTYSVCCNKCNLGLVGQGDLPEFWITKLIEQGYLQQLRRRPVERKVLRDFVTKMLVQSDHRWTPQEVIDELLDEFEVFHKGGK